MNRREVLAAAGAVAVAATVPSITTTPAAPWRVFRVSEVEWFVARSPEEALRCAAANWGCSAVPLDLEALVADLEHDGLVEGMPEDIGEAGLDQLKMTQTNADGDLLEDEDGAPLPPITFREELERMVARGLDAPAPFAAAEW